MSFNIWGTEESFNNLRHQLDLFGRALRLWINWDKSFAYWLASAAPLNWLLHLECPWAEENNLNKLLGTPFGINPLTTDVDSFLRAKITKEFTFWTYVHFSLASRSFIVNSVLLSSLWYFLSIWGGVHQGPSGNSQGLRNFLWSGHKHHYRARVSWSDCCVP